MMGKITICRITFPILTISILTRAGKMGTLYWLILLKTIPLFIHIINYFYFCVILEGYKQRQDFAHD